MEFLKKILTWLVMGLLVGTGFSVAMYGVGYFALKKFEEKTSKISSEAKKASEDISIRSFRKEFGPDSGLEITSYKENVIKNRLNILGVLENKGQDTWGSVSLEVELFDKSGAFVNECTEYIQGNIRPGDKVNFKVSCNSCGDIPLPKYEKFTITVTNAYYKRTDKDT